MIHVHGHCGCPLAARLRPTQVAHTDRNETKAVVAVDQRPHALPRRAQAVDGEAAQRQRRVEARQRQPDADRRAQRTNINRRLEQIARSATLEPFVAQRVEAPTRAKPAHGDQRQHYRRSLTGKPGTGRHGAGDPQPTPPGSAADPAPAAGKRAASPQPPEQRIDGRKEHGVEDSRFEGQGNEGRCAWGVEVLGCWGRSDRRRLSISIVTPAGRSG